ncbi:MAG: 4Fe-4S dicluster domain-containing protein [Phycisphaerae bacterium]
MSRRFGTFTGGIDLPYEKEATLESPIRPCRRPSRLLVPLAPTGREASEPTVGVGEYVSAGEKLAAGGDAGAVYAPLAGRVASRTTALVAVGGDFTAVPALELVDLGEHMALRSLEQVFDWRRADADTLRRRLSQGGLVLHRRWPTSLNRWLSEARRHNCRTLIANAMEGQSYVTSDHRLLVEHGAEVSRGLAILARAIEADDILLAVDRRRTDDYRDLVGPARMYDIKRIALPHKYPIGADNVLVKVLLRREPPPGAGPMSVAAAVIDAATCLAVYRWVACASPPRGRVVTISGERAIEHGNFYVPFGTEWSDLPIAAEPPVIHGGPMMGRQCEPGLVVGPATTALLALRPSDNNAPPSPCIRCGWCTDHCPARLNVAALNDDYELSLVDHARKMNVAACVDCGVCTYVCPARLPLSQRVRQLKRAVRSRP